MNSETMLRDFLDGDLDQADQELLFQQLSVDSDLRRVLQEHLRIGSIVQQDIPTIAAPASAGAHIFAALGYGAAATSLSWSARAMGGLRRWGSHALAAAGGAVVALLLTLVAMGGFSQDEVQDGGDRYAFVEVPMPFPWPEQIGSGSPTVASSELPADIPVVPAQPAQETVVRNMPAPTSNAAITTDNASKTENADQQQLREPESSDLESHSSPQKPASLQTPVLRSNPLPTTDAILIAGLERPSQSETRAETDPLDIDEFAVELEELRDMDFSIELRTLIGNSSPDVTLPSQVDGFTADRSLAFTYEFGNNFVLGIEGGRESFGQEYRTVIQDRAATVRQNPQLFWAGLVTRYDLRVLSPVDVVFPYVQSIVGTSEVGPLGKGIVGLRTTPEEPIVLSLGVEFSRLWYNINGARFTSDKLGWFYGASVRF